ncbi:unnamed protein product, partial [Ectocarpus sp. 6 AP-2014]
PELDACGDKDRVDGVLAGSGLDAGAVLGGDVVVLDVAAVAAVAVRVVRDLVVVRLLWLDFGSTAGGAAAVGVVRVSVVSCWFALEELLWGKSLRHEAAGAELKQDHGLLQIARCHGGDTVVLAKVPRRSLAQQRVRLSRMLAAGLVRHARCHADA